LHKAAYFGHTAVASYLVEMGIEVDVRNKVGGCMTVFWLDWGFCRTLLVV
jgi:hypothetical protein